ncbi:ABC transporter ATP-binding protein [Acuticoccus kandeliae]|uniref:ABC transporter ATP-binding protein n=1 Tax=Acuticoccus kandeliae TaxID=2073160 RepID=UPI001FEAF341|nr:ABC transporter ATP-binding protein [Acuticoccus kandeliae]
MTYTMQSGREVTALSEVSLSIRRDEFLTIVGPSGCGKSTLLKILGKIIPATSGEVRLNGETLTRPTADISICFQQSLLFPWRTAEENILFPIEMLGRSKKAYRDAVRELIQMVGLTGFEKSYPRELSGGMQQRVAICRALVTDPPILLMDEPFAALDAMTRDEIGIELLRIWNERKKTVVFVTHSIPESILLADRVMIMSARPGKIDQIIEIDLPRPRTLSMVSTPEFGRYAEFIRGRIAAARQAAA